ncbi:molybdopterin-dependent oxidoreductase [Microtetraspora malaysiensis]|uniref:molybdopterin-dependent oxidoreductase n=1 Tax=Microtetraspora malaysiensis TaxID=161358 RepID=UPI000829EDA4|nr:molybdopterin-dependent oxidoreductase [Microtetraspora malaysiensis]
MVADVVRRVEAGENLGALLPVAKAPDDVLVAYEMNGRPLPPDHGHPARLVVPGWASVAWITWLGDIRWPSPWSRAAASTACTALATHPVAALR